MGVTIKDIANVAGVSYSTVSKALNHSPLVKQETKDKIIKIAEKMGYEPNYAARRLVSKETKVIGLIWPTIERVVLSTLVTNISREINKTPYSMILSVDPVQEAIDTFRKYQVDGIIMFEESIVDTVSLNSGSIPILSYGVSKKSRSNYPVIDPNHEQAMHKAIKHLYQLGHNQIGYIGYMSSSDPMQLAKISGFKKALKKYNIEQNEEFIIDTEGLDWYDGYTATNKLLTLEKCPTAIVGGSYDISGGIIRAIKEKNLNIPSDVSIISYDNVPQMANMEVPLTCVGAPIELVASAIVRSMIAMIKSEQQTPFVKKVSPALVKRVSTTSINGR